MEIVDRICPVCGISYKANSTRLKFGRETTCGRICSYKLRGNKISKPIILNCGNCGVEIIRCPSTVESKHKAVFCSTTCQYKARSKGITKRIVDKPYAVINPISTEKRREMGLRTWIKRRANGTDLHTEETRRILSEITTNNIASGKINRISKIEYIVADILTDLGIDFTHQYPIRSKETGRYIACVDFFIKSANIVIEVNGTFWHADKRFYHVDNLSPAQVRTLTKYAAKIRVLDKLGIRVIEVWEYDIKTSLDKVREYLSTTFVG